MAHQLLKYLIQNATNHSFWMWRRRFCFIPVWRVLFTSFHVVYFRAFSAISTKQLAILIFIV